MSKEAFDKIAGGLKEAIAVAGGDVEALAESWASIDGKLEMFLCCKREADVEEKLGYYGGYMAEAEEMIKRLGARGYKVAPNETKP